MIKKIVIAEDDDAIAHMVSMALGDSGFLCIRARDGQEALQLTKLHQPDVLVLDVMMPRMDGRDVARQLKGDVLLSKIPILMLTALSDVDSKVAGLDAGADDYVSKPFDLRELAARVRALIRANKRERDRNGITDLPGSRGIDEHIRSLLASDEPMGVLQIGVPEYGAIVQTGSLDDSLLGDWCFSSEKHRTASHGSVISSGCEANLLEESFSFVQALANFCLIELRGCGGGFLGHLGGTDFVASCSEANIGNVTAALLQGFDLQSRGWLPESQARTATSLRIVMGSAMTRNVASEDELGKRLAAASREARNAKGSSHVLWKE